MAKIVTFDPKIRAALDMLEDPEKCVELEIVRGKAAGILNIIHSLFPPDGIERKDVTANFTFPTNIAINTSVKLMVMMVCEDGSGSLFVLGIVPKESGWMETVSDMERFVGVRFDPTRREGVVIVMRSLCEKLRDHLFFKPCDFPPEEAIAANRSK